MTTAAPPARFTPPRRFDNGAEWLRALGDVPLERVIFDPWPGTATEADLLRLVERDKRLCELVDGTLVENRRDGPNPSSRRTSSPTWALSSSNVDSAPFPAPTAPFAWRLPAACRLDQPQASANEKRPVA